MVSDVVPVAVPVCDEQMATPLIGVVIPFVVQLDDQSMLRWSVPLPLFQVQRVSSKLGVNATHLETAIAGDVIVVYADTNTDNINIIPKPQEKYLKKLYHTQKYFTMCCKKGKNIL